MAFRHHLDLAGPLGDEQQPGRTPAPRLRRLGRGSWRSSSSPQVGSPLPSARCGCPAALAVATGTATAISSAARSARPGRRAASLAGRRIRCSLLAGDFKSDTFRTRLIALGNIRSRPWLRPSHPARPVPAWTGPTSNRKRRAAGRASAEGGRGACFIRSPEARVARFRRLRTEVGRKFSRPLPALPRLVVVMDAFTTSQPPVHGAETPAGPRRATIGAMPINLSSCSRCGSILDAPRANPSTGEIARKCCDCASWQPLPQALAGPPRRCRDQSRLPRP